MSNELRGRIVEYILELSSAEQLRVEESKKQGGSGSYARARMFSASYGRRYCRIVEESFYNELRPSQSVHSFVDMQNGNVLKAAGWKAPQKDREGNLAVRFNLINDESRAECFTALRMDRGFGGYLYSR